MGTITLTIYTISLVIGVVYVIIGSILGEIGHHGVELAGQDTDLGGADVGHDMDVGHDVGHADAGHLAHDTGLGHEHISPFKPLTIATFMTGFGGLGLISQLGLKVSPLVSLFVAGPGALAIAAIEFAAFVRLIIGAEASSEATFYETLGSEAEVTVAIPENGLGQVAYHIKGFRYMSPARSDDGKPIKQGERVRIMKCSDNIYTVRRL